MEVQAIAAAGSYVGAALAMTVINKYIVSVLMFPGMNTLLFFECAFAALSLKVMRLEVFRPFDPLVFKHLSAVSICKGLNMILSFVAMKYTSLPVYNVLKRSQCVFSVMVDMTLRGTRFSNEVITCIILMTVGAIITGSGDLDFNLLGYLVAIPAGLANAAHLVLAARAYDRVPGLTTPGVLYYTALYELLLFFPLSCLEFSSVKQYFATSEVSLEGDLAMLCLYALIGTLLNFATFWCTIVTSPVSTSVTGNLKALFSTWIGCAYFGTNLTVTGWIGLCISTAGGMLYPVARVREAREAREAKAAGETGKKI